MEELQLQLEELNSYKDELQASIKSIDVALAECRKGLRSLYGQLYASGYWARPKRSKCIVRH